VENGIGKALWVINLYKMNNLKNMKESTAYSIFNKIIILLILSAIAYPIISELLNLNFSCQYKQLFGVECRSCGITRGLKACLKLDFLKAKEFNNQSIFFFLIFIFQFLLRFTLLFIEKFKNIYFTKFLTQILVSDLLIIISLCLFNIFYYG
jgi:hypothetical protein